MSIIKARLVQKTINDVNVIQLETSSNLILRPSGNETVETAISRIDTVLDGVDDALELLLSGDQNE